jgi:amidophosphoribosyltransferase
MASRSFAKAFGKESLFRPIYYKMRGERSFQGTNKEDRKNSINSNLHILPNVEKSLTGKTIVLIDDSTIRGNNSKRAIEILKRIGVKKIFLLNYTPRIGIIGGDGTPRGCMWGVDMPPEDDFIVRDKEKLKNRSDLDISREIGAEIRFLSIEGMFRAFERCGIKRENLCSYCIGGRHPFC